MRLHDGGLDLALDPARHLSVIDPDRRQMTISARLAVRAAGHREVVTPFPDGPRADVVARRSLGLPRSASDDDRAQLDLIARRATNRRPFHDRPIGQAVADQLVHTARAGRAWLQRLLPDGKHALAGLVAEADRRQGSTAQPLRRRRGGRRGRRARE